MADMRCAIHWLSFVVTGSKEDGFAIYERFFKDSFGELQSTGHGGRGFAEIWHSLLEFKVYVSPRHGEVERFHFEIPGEACEVIPWETWQRLDGALQADHPQEYHYSRLDCAFDDLPFSPQDVEDAIKAESVRSLGKKETMQVHKSPFVMRANGEIGTHTVEFGSRFSERMIRVYNRRGFTRLELELKGRRADVVAKRLFRAAELTEWWPIMVSHLRDYIDFEAPWWEAFVGGVGRANIEVSTPKEISAERIKQWLERQVSPALSVIHDMLPEYFLKDLIRQGRMKRGNRYDLLLAGTQMKMDFYDELGRRVWVQAEEAKGGDEASND